MPHNFGRPRPSKSAGFSLHTDAGQAQRDAHFHSLPPATGVPPYHLQLADILPAAQIQAQKLIFHVNGDVGGIKNLSLIHI